MKELYLKHIAELLQVKVWQVENCADLFAEGDTIPFISRYRKEKTGGMDDSTVAEVKHWVDVFDALETRKATMLKVISEAGALTPELKEKIENSVSSTEIEDLYLPWRPKRRTRASVAREKGLGPLAEALLDRRTQDPLKAAAAFTSDKVGSVEEALAGARDIIAEKVAETALVRENQRAAFRQRRLVSKATKAASSDPEASKYRSYFNFT
ncbi:MAG: RNA-binding transcriptional accessory protein, partial [Bacteroidales bacterium]|nr:RNA-binding transcriptional accessory protein [Bacteroidales bacterium]